MKFTIAIIAAVCLMAVADAKSPWKVQGAVGCAEIGPGKSACVREAKVDADKKLDKVFLGCKGGMGHNDCTEGYALLTEALEEADVECEGGKCKSLMPKIKKSQCQGLGKGLLKNMAKAGSELKPEARFMCARVHDPEAYGVAEVEGMGFPKKICLQRNEACFDLAEEVEDEEVSDDDDSSSSDESGEEDINEEEEEGSESEEDNEIA